MENINQNESDTFADRAIGCLLGGIIGDTIGSFNQDVEEKSEPYQMGTG